MTDSVASPPVPPSKAAPIAGRHAYARPAEVVTILFVLALDQLTKHTVKRYLDLHDTVTVIPGFLDLTHVQNTGAAFGILNASDFAYKPLVMIAIAAIALLAIAAYGAQLAPHERFARFGLALILGGAFGNLMDRALSGHVVDFVDVYWGTAHFWAFNVADAAITVGAAFVLLDMFGIGRDHVSHPV